MILTRFKNERTRSGARNRNADNKSWNGWTALSRQEKARLFLFAVQFFGISPWVLICKAFRICCFYFYLTGRPLGDYQLKILLTTKYRSSTLRECLVLCGK